MPESKKYLGRLCYTITFTDKNVHHIFEISEQIFARMTLETWCTIEYASSLNIEAEFIKVTFMVDTRCNRNVDKDIKHIDQIIKEELSKFKEFD